MLRPGLRIAEPVSLADLAPSVSSLLGLPPVELDGRDLAGALRSGREPERGDLYAETEYPAGFGWQPLAALRRGGHKVISGSAAELYDLGADPAESRDLAVARRDDLGELVRALRVRQRERPVAPATPVDRIDRETAARLQSLGYLAAAPAPAKGPPREPRAMLAAFALFEEAGWDRARGDDRAAVDKLRRALAGDAGNPAFLGALAQAERAAGDAKAAALTYRAAIERSPRDARLWLDLAWTLQESGQLKDAGAAAQEALRLDASSGEAHNALGICAALNGDATAARSHFERATALEPRSATAWNNLGNAWRALRRPAEAADAYSRAATLAPGWADPLNGLGVIEIDAGRPGDALAYFDRALVLQPDFEEARRNRAVALRRR
jgi:Flp pilus assembly protein TadD